LYDLSIDIGDGLFGGCKYFYKWPNMMLLRAIRFGIFQSY